MAEFNVGDLVEFIDTYEDQVSIGDRATVSSVDGDIVYLDGLLGHPNLGAFWWRLRKVDAQELIGYPPTNQPLILAPVDRRDGDEDVFDATGKLLFTIEGSSFDTCEKALEFAQFVTDAINEKVGRERS